MSSLDNQQTPNPNSVVYSENNVSGTEHQPDQPEVEYADGGAVDYAGQEDNVNGDEDQPEIEYEDEGSGEYGGQEDYDGGQEGYDEQEDHDDLNEDQPDQPEIEYADGDAGDYVGQDDETYAEEEVEETGEYGTDYDEDVEQDTSPDHYDRQYRESEYEQPQNGQSSQFEQSQIPIVQPQSQYEEKQLASQQPEQARSAPVQQAPGANRKRRSNLIVCLFLLGILLTIAITILVVSLVLFLGKKDQPAPAPPPKYNDILVTKAPTPAPNRASPSPDSSQWQLGTGGTIAASRTGANFGLSLAGVGGYLLAGLPDKAGTAGLGSVLAFQRPNLTQSGAVRSAFSSLGGLGVTESEAEQYGSAVDAAVDPSGNLLLLVGAPRTNGVFQNVVSFGSAYYYVLSNGSWKRVGNTIRSGETLVESGGRFGAAVALASSIKRIAVGAPSRSTDTANLHTGGVTVFDFDGSNWTTAATAPLVGAKESYFGSSVDMSADGNSLLVGAPGNGTMPGAVTYYKSTGSNAWSLFFSFNGASGSSDSLGTKVLIIGTDLIALGAPGSYDSKGSIKVFQVQPGYYVQMGADIKGNKTNDKVGTVMCSKNGRLALGTQNGDLYVYNYSGNTWKQVGNVPNAGSAIKSCTIADSGDSVVLGLDNDKLAVFDLSQSG